MRTSPASALYHPLDGILGSPALVRVARILAAHGGSLDVAGIARRTRLSLPSVRSALRRFREIGLITVAGAGRSIVCSLAMSHPMAAALVALFEAERRQAEHVFDSVRAAADALQPHARAVWLYGSVARGEDDGASDIDVAVVSERPRASAQAEELRDAIARALPDQAHRFSVVAIPSPDVRKMASARDRFWRELERDAVVLAGDAPSAVAGRRKPRAAD